MSISSNSVHSLRFHWNRLLDCHKNKIYRYTKLYSANLHKYSIKGIKTFQVYNIQTMSIVFVLVIGMSIK